MKNNEIEATKVCLNNLLKLQGLIEYLIKEIHADDGTKEKSYNKCDAMVQAAVIFRCLDHGDKELSILKKQIKGEA